MPRQISLAKEYEVSDKNIYGWIKRYGKIKTSDGTVTNNDEIIQLRKEMAKVKEENEVLKKCVSIFSIK